MLELLHFDPCKESEWMNKLSEFILERERTKENDVFGQIYALLIKAQYIDDVEFYKTLKLD